MVRRAGLHLSERRRVMGEAAGDSFDGVVDLVGDERCIGGLVGVASRSLPPARDAAYAAVAAAAINDDEGCEGRRDLAAPADAAGFEESNSLPPCPARKVLRKCSSALTRATPREEIPRGTIGAGS